MKSFVKRIIPFILTFALGLLVASFFINVSAPRFNFKCGSRHGKIKRVKYENERLRKENERLEQQIKEAQITNYEFRNLNVPPPPMPPMPPPPPPARHR